MRSFISIVESAQHWPETISGDQLTDYAMEWHHTPDDFEDGDIGHNIMAFGKYHLRRISLSEISLDLFHIDDDLKREYAALPAETSPPIIVNLGEGRWGKGWIIDGNHRANAAAMRGDKDILAYVGDPSTYDPPEEDEGEEWNDEYVFVRESQIDPTLRFPKPSRVIRYDDDDGEGGAIWIGPSEGTVLKCIGPYDCRAIIYSDGLLVVWAQMDMYHRDVYESLNRGVDFQTLMLFHPSYDPGVSVKGDSEESTPLTDENWLKAMHSNRALRNIYGENFQVVIENWF